MTLEHAEHPFPAPRRSISRRADPALAPHEGETEAAERVAREPGRPLEPGTRAEMEGPFAHDFGNVRIHADGASAEASRDMGALAYSLGPHLVFGAGQFEPQTPHGKRLLAHELAHVVQQDTPDQGDAHNAPGATNADLENDANHAAEAAVAGRPASLRSHASSHAPLRQAAPAAGPAAKPEAPPRPRREERLNIGRGGKRVDAELDRDVGWLTVKMKVKFQQVDIPDPWPSPARFAEFQTKFIETVARRWSFKHYLVPASACPGEPQRVSVRLQLIPVSSGAQATIKVAYKPGRSRAGKGTAELDVLDVSRRGDIPQTPAEHEFGHMLGLPHIHCPGDEPDCYGTTSSEKADIMGSGSYVSPRDYEPFAELMYYFTSCNYNVRPASQIPTSRGPDIGAGIGLLAGGAAGAAIGSLLGPVGLIAGAVLGAVGGFFAGRFLGTPEVPS